MFTRTEFLFPPGQAPSNYAEVGPTSLYDQLQYVAKNCHVYSKCIAMCIVNALCWLLPGKASRGSITSLCSVSC